MTDTQHDEPLEALLRELARVQQHHAERASNPELASALLHLGRWQSLRLRNTYADLEQTPRYATAMKFFEEDLYGGADFAQRDADRRTCTAAQTSRNATPISSRSFPQ